MTLQELLDQIRSPDPGVRTAAWQEAGTIGATAVQPLAQLAADKEMEVARAARRGLEKIVRTSGAPGSGNLRKTAIDEFLALLKNDLPASLRRDVLWMLSEIGGDESVEPIAALLGDEVFREDARMALERIPGEESMAALRAALQAVPEGFRPHIVQSLRARGEKLDPEKYPCRKLTPTR